MTHAPTVAPASRNASESVPVVGPFKPAYLQVVPGRRCVWVQDRKPEMGLEPMTYRYKATRRYVITRRFCLQNGMFAVRVQQPTFG